MENEFINMIKSEVASYGTAIGKAGQLKLIGVVSRVLGLFLLIFTIILLVSALLSFGAVAIIAALAKHMPIWSAALIMGGLYIVLIGVAYAFRKPLFIHPFIRLMTKQVRSEEELALKTMEAEHEVEIQRVRMDSRFENATRELNFVLSLISYGWKFIRKIIKK